MSENKLYTLSKDSVKIVQGIVEKARSAPPPAMLPPSGFHYNVAPDAYWALPPCETGLPAATRDANGNITPGKAYCCIYKYDKPKDKLLPIVDGFGFPIRFMVYNYYNLLANDYVQVWRHKNGYWTNERPIQSATPTPSSTSSTTTLTPLVTGVPRCQGECLWIATDKAGGGFVWKNPVGGCANTTTTTTSTTSTTSSTTGTTSTTTLDPSSTTSTTTTTLPPCSGKPCLLRCVQVTTTTAGPGTTTVAPTTSWPAAWQPQFVYQVVSDLYNFPCQQPCSCYGAGDPCFLEDGEIVSQCLLLVTTTTATPTSTTTLGPITGPQTCNLAEAALGTPAPDTYRASTLQGLPNGWIVCKDCDEGKFPVFPIGSVPTKANAFGNQTVLTHESPCLVDPCERNLSQYPTNRAVYRAFILSDQRWFWGGDSRVNGLIQSDDEKFAANWRICVPCAAGYRPLTPPSPWIYFDSGKNSGITMSEDDGMYLYSTECIPGPPCEACGLLPDTDGFDKINQATSSTTSTTTAKPTPAPTTTLPPCGCEPPSFCPSSNNECVKTECKPGGAAGTTPICPIPTTTGPNQCWDGTKTCNCNTTTTTGTSTTTTTTLPPGGCGSCQWEYRQTGIGSYQWIQTQSCINGCVCQTPSGTPVCGQTASTECRPVPPPPNTTNPPCLCGGSCGWYSQSVGSGESRTYIWARAYSSCLSNWCACDCDAPSGVPSGVCATAETQCQIRQELTTIPVSTTGGPGTTTTSAPGGCGCCTTAACDKVCVFKGNDTGGWNKISDPCPTTCPCPQYPPTASQSNCDVRSYKCGSSVPTTQAPPTSSSTTSTTPAPGACCYGDGTCLVVPYSWCRGIGSVFQGAGVSCASVSCPTSTTLPPTPLGVCCVGNGGVGIGDFCLGNVSWTYCEYLGGYFLPGYQCDTPGSFRCRQTTQAPIILGRCCIWRTDYEPFYLCAVNSEDACQASRAIYEAQFPNKIGYSWTAGGNCNNPLVCQGGTSSTTSTTPAPIGACCYGDASGLICSSGQTQAQCAALAGVWYQGQTCTDGGCQGVCCRFGACYDAAYSPSSCSAAGGTWIEGGNCSQIGSLCTTTPTPATTTSTPPLLP